MKNKNFMILWVRDSLFAAGASLTSASVLSGHLIYIGMKEDKISLYLAAVPMINLVVSLLFSGITARVGKTVPVYSLLCLVSGILTGLYSLLFGVVSVETVLFIFLMVLGCLLSAVTAIRNIFDYKLPCEVMNPDDYSDYVSISGIISSVFGLAAGMVISFGYRNFSFKSVTCGAYLSAGLLLCAASFINRKLRYTMPENRSVQKTTSGSLKALFADRSFRLLVIPNLIRGIGMAVVPMMTLLAVDADVLKETDGATVTVCTYLATLLSGMTYVYLSRKIGVKRLCLFGALLFCAVIPSFAGSKIWFYVCYTVSYTGYYIVNCAVPDFVYKNVNQNMMSIFHTWRLAFSTIGTTIATTVIGKLIGTVSPVWILCIGGVSNVLCAIAYYSVFRANRKQPIVSASEREINN